MGAPGVAIPTGELERSLARVQERLGERLASTEETEDRAPAPATVPRLPPFTRRTRLFLNWSDAGGPYALAASLLLAALGLSLGLAVGLDRERRRLPELESRLAAAMARSRAAEAQLAAAQQQATTLDQQVGTLRQERDHFLAPQANTPILDLRLYRERGGGEAGISDLAAKPTTRFVTLVLENPEEGRFSAHRARFLDGQGRLLFAVEGLEPTRYRSFVITLARATLPAGEVRVLLEGQRGSRWVGIAEYRLRRRE